MRRIRRALSVEDMRKLARRRLPKAAFDIIDGGHADGVTLRANRAAFERVSVRPRALIGVTEVDLRTTVLGDRLSMPILLAPCGSARVAHPRAESAAARAADRAGTAYIIPNGASNELETIARESSGPLWYQLYLSVDANADNQRVQRAAASGCRVLCLTVDTPAKPFRETDLRNGVDLPVKITPRLLAAGITRPRWAKDFLVGNVHSGFSLTDARTAYHNFAGTVRALKPVQPADVARLRETWAGPLVVKGVLRHEDIEQLVGLGVDGVVVSNHGGRNLDGAVSTLDVLPRIVETADGRLEVLVDSGVRRGVDVLKALALGARAVLVGRPYMYGLAAGGDEGVQKVLSILENEFRLAMTFSGAASLAEVDASLIEPSPRHR